MKRVQINLEFIFRASPTILYRFLTTPATLIRWFCDEVDISADGVYTFVWEGSEEVATLTEDIEDERLRFKWEDAEDEEEYLEFRMSKSDITSTTILEITDYCDEDEVKDTSELWIAQIKQLKQEIGG